MQTGTMPAADAGGPRGDGGSPASRARLRVAGGSGAGPEPGAPGPAVAEEVVVIGAAARQGAVLRLLGGRAVRHLCAGHIPDERLRPPGDLDFFGRGRDRSVLLRVLPEFGYVPDREFNLLQGRTRLLFVRDGVKVDVFLDEFRMCHRLDLRARLDLGEIALPLADLLLTKLQVVQFTEKDRRDAVALLWRAEPGRGPAGLDAAYVAGLCARDWGLWRTVTGNLARLRPDLPAPAAARSGELESAIAAAPKSAGWRMRSVLGDRTPWYELPEEP